MARRLFQTVLPLGLLACGPGSAVPPVTITVDSTRRYQTMSGWEASESFGWALPPAVMDSLLDMAVNDLGINRLRLSVPGNMIESRDSTTIPEETSIGSNDNSDPDVLNPAGFRWQLFDCLVTTFALPLKRRVEARGEPFTLVTTFVGFRPTSEYQQREAREYVEFMLAVLGRMRDTHRLVPDVWEVRLEPDHGRTQLSPEEQGRLLRAAGEAARAHGYDRLMFLVPSTVVPHRTVQYLGGILAVPGTRPFIREITFHRYSDPPREVLRRIRDTAASLGLPTAMLEYLRGTEHHLYEDLTEANVSAWSRFSLAGPYGGPDQGGQYFFADTAAGTFRYRSTTWPLRQYFRYIRPGDVRLGASSRNAGTEPVAFRRPDGGMTVVANIAGAADVTIAGLRPGRYQVSWSTRDQPGWTGPVVVVAAGAPLVTALPAAGTLTVSPASAAAGPAPRPPSVPR
jgi:hypothetical protein